MRTSLRNADEALLVLIPKNLGAFLAGNNDLEIAVGIQVGGNDVQSNACTLGRHMLAKGLELFVPSVVHDNRNIVGTRIPTVVTINAFSSDQFVHHVAI